MARFSIRAVFAFGWETMKKHFGFFFVLLLMVLVFNIAMRPLIAPRPNSVAVPLTFRILHTIVMAIINLGLIRISLRFADNLRNSYGELFACLPMTISYIISSFLFSLILVIGLALLIVPGIYFGVRLHFYKYFIVDQSLGPIEALKASWRMTENEFFNLLGFLILLFLINLAGLALFVVGLFATLPTTMVAHAKVFRRLQLVTA